MLKRRGYLQGSLRCVLVLALVVSAGAVRGASFLDAEEHPQMKKARELYAAQSWPRGEMRPGLILEDLAIEGYEGGKVERETLDMVARRYEGSEERSALLVELTVADDVGAAHDRLVEYVAFVSSPNTLPTTAASGMRAGDVGYVGHSGAGPDRISWIAFVQGNLAVRLVCLDPRVTPHPDLGHIAAEIARTIEAMPSLKAGAIPPRPIIQRLAAETSVCKLGDVVPLKVKVADPYGRRPMLEWVVGGPGQGYVEQDGAGRLELHTTGPGMIRLKLRATGSNGTLSEGELVLEVMH